MIVLITGKSASGKTTLMNLLQYVFDNAGIIKSVTTRKPQLEDSSEYECLSYEEFKSSINNREFVSWRKGSKDELRKDDYYGVRFSDVNRSLLENELSIRSVTPSNVQDWNRYYGEKTVFIHLLAPTEAETRRRILTRGGLNESEIIERIRLERHWDEGVIALKESGIPIYLI